MIFELSLTGVLVVEDDWLIAAEIVDALASAGIGTLGPANSVSAALDIIAANEPHAIGAAILDVRLGQETVEPVAAALAARGVPFVYATGRVWQKGDAVDQVAPRLVKPIDLRHLVEVLRTLTASRALTPVLLPTASSPWSAIAAAA